jgi:hypothetical protein
MTDNGRKMMALQVVWDHWIKPDIEARKMLLDNERKKIMSRWLTRRTHIEDMLVLVEMWVNGVGEINNQDIHSILIRKARFLWRNDIAVGPCLACGRHVSRMWYEVDGFSIACSSGECDNVGLLL